MRVNVDSKALKDPRFRRMGRELQIHWREALGLCIEVWNYAYEQRSGYLTRDDVDSIVDRDGVGAAMLKADLAELEREQLRLRGVRARIGYLMKQAERGRAGGRARAAAANPKQPGRLQANAKRPLKRTHGDLDLDQPPDTALDRDQALVLTSPAEASSAPRSRVVPDTSAAIAIFCDRYKAKYGHACTVTQRDAGTMARLVKSSTRAEVERRIEILFASPPAFLADAAPDIATLGQHWN